MAYVLMFAVISLLVLIHEFGHLIGAKIVGIPISQFSVGFGPKLWGFSVGGTEYRLSMIPLGGYVLPGVADVSEFNRLPASRRSLFALAGPMGNLLAAFLVSSLLNIAAAGFSFHSMFLAPLVGVWHVSEQVLGSIPILFQHPDRLSGILGIVAAGGQAAGANLQRILDISILLNVNLAIFNLLPLPPLDGGKIVMYGLEGLYKPLRRLEVPLAMGGWVLFFSLMIYATVLDIHRIVA